MPMWTNPLSSGIPDTFPAILDSKGNLDPAKITDLLHFEKREVAQAAQIPSSKVRWGAKMPQQLRERLLVWARLLALVAEYFDGDPEKTANWFQTESEYLGGWSPREYIKFGRAGKLEQFILHALDENRAA